jgi:hypothetical protein
MEHELIGGFSCGLSLILYSVDLYIFWETFFVFIDDPVYLFYDMDCIGSLEFCDSEIDGIVGLSSTSVLVVVSDISRSRLYRCDILEEDFFSSIEYEWIPLELIDSVSSMIEIDRVSMLCRGDLSDHILPKTRLESLYHLDDIESKGLNTLRGELDRDVTRISSDDIDHCGTWYGFYLFSEIFGDMLEVLSLGSSIDMLC